VNTEIASGLNAGERYVATDSFVVKAELEKSAAGHGH
jgi:cobalt-zinc-cadmium efflux system membrane fusion protein